MKKVALILFLFVCVFDANSQQEIELDELASPSLPAFSIIGKSTEEVSRPTDLRAVTTTLQNAVGQTGFIGDMGVEFNPFWMSMRRKPTFDDYYNLAETEKPARENVLKNIANTSSFSIATGNYFNEVDSLDAKRMGLGYRCHILSGHASDSLKTLKAQLARADVLSTLSSDPFLLESANDSSRTISEKRAEVMLLMKSLIELDNNIPVDEKATFLEYLNAELNSCEYTEQLIRFIENPSVGYSRELLMKLDKAQKERVGLIVEVATALNLDFPTNNFDLSYGRKAGAWLTIDYRSDNGLFDFVGLARYVRNIEFENNGYDMGARLNINLEKFYLAAELIHRSEQRRYDTVDFNGNNIVAVEENTSVRYDINFQYALSENLSLSGVFGKDWEGNTTSEANLLAQIGVNFNFGKRTVSMTE